MTGEKLRPDLIVEIDQRKLAVLIGGAVMDIPVPVGADPQALLDQCDPDMVARFMAAAEAAMRYLTERINAGQRPS